MPQPEDTRQVEIAPDKARQGRRGYPVMWVLVAGLVLVMIGWFFVEIYGAYIAPPVSEQIGDPSNPGGPNTGEQGAPADQ